MKRFLEIATIFIALCSLVISIYSFNISKDTRDAQEDMSHFSNVATISAVHDTKSDNLHINTTEEFKKLYGGIFIFPTEFGINHFKFVVPNNKVNFAPIREATSKLLFEMYDLGSGQIPDIGSYVRFPIPVGIVVASAHQGGSYLAASYYILYVGCDFSRALKGSPEQIDVTFLDFINQGRIELPGFRIYKLPWKTLSKYERDQIIETRRTKEIQDAVDIYWQAFKEDN